MTRTLTKSLEAEKLHQPMITSDRIVPIMPLHENRRGEWKEGGEGGRGGRGRVGGREGEREGTGSEGVRREGGRGEGGRGESCAIINHKNEDLKTH